MYDSPLDPAPFPVATPSPVVMMESEADSERKDLQGVGWLDG